MKKRILWVIASVVLVITLTAVTVFGTEAANDRKISVNLGDVITENFIGVGSNLWTGTLTRFERENYDSNEANFAITEKRISTVRPGLIRLLVLPDWFIKFTDEDPTGEANWLSGNYNFDTENMYTICKYIECFQKAGTEVQINLGGQASHTIAPWYSIKDVSAVEKSAPANLEAFGKAAAALLKYLRNDRGFTCVGALSFYNEVNGNNWQAFGDEREHWVSMLKNVDAALKTAGIRDKIKIVGTELTADSALIVPSYDWIKFVHDNAKGYYDVFSVHTYMSNIDKNASTEYFNNYTAINKWLKKVKKLIGDDQLRVTEYTNNGRANNDKGDSTFGVSFMSSLLAGVNAGCDAMADWFFCGTYIPDPLGVSLRGTSGVLWDIPNATETVYWSFNERGLVMRYIPKNSKVVNVTCDNDDIIAAAFVKGDDITVVVETDESTSSRDLKIDFGKNINKSFKRFVCDYPANSDVPEKKLQDGGNALLTRPDASFKVTKTLEDSLANGHRLIIYTTMAEAVQVELDGKIARKVDSGSSVQLSVKKVHAADSDAVTWSVYNYYVDGKAYYLDDSSLTAEQRAAAGTVDDTGKYSAVGVKAGTKVAVKATAADGSAYAVSYITVS